MERTEIEEVFEGLGEVSVRRMFGGQGVYHRGLIVAVVLEDELMLKGDEVSGPDLEAAGARRWRYQREGRSPVAMPYWSIPEAAYDDPEQMAQWVRLAYAAALRSASAKPRKRGARPIG